MAGPSDAGQGRWVEVAPERLPRWLTGFAARHGEPAVTVDGGVLTLRAPDGEVAECHLPPGAQPSADPAGFVAAATAPRRLGLVLVRRGGLAIGVSHGDRLVSSKVDTVYVQGRTAAGGWSQQRFARRRDNQARALAAGAADLAARLLLPPDRLDAVVTGGDRLLVDAVLADPRLRPLRALRSSRFLHVADPRLAVLRDAVRAARAVRIRLHTAALPRIGPSVDPGGHVTETPRMTLTATVLDAPDPRALAAFYHRLLGWPIGRDEPDWATVRPPGGGAGLSFQLEAAYVRPTWPAGPGDQQMQMHLDIEVEDLEQAGAHAIAAGATLADHQPQEHVRVYLDPAGHPFCLWVPE